MSTSRLVVVTVPELAPGFELAGAQTLVAASVDEARAWVLPLLADPSVGVIALHEPWLLALPEEDRVRVEASTHPVVVPLPSGEPVDASARRRARMAELLERAVGFQLTFRPDGASS